MGFLSSLFGSASAKSLQTRAQLEASTGNRYFPAAGSDAFDWRTGGTSAGIGPNDDLIARRAVAMSRNNALAANGVAAIVSATIGDAGFVAAPSASLNRATRRILQAKWRTWAKQCDADGRTDFGGLQVEMMRSIVVRGEVLIQLITTPDGLKLRLIPAEMLDRSITIDLLPSGGCIIEGVEFAADGTRAAYWVLPRRPGALNTFAGSSVRIVAADMLHVFRPTEIGQVRGLSWFAPVLVALAELDQLTDALLVGAKTAAMFAGFLTDATDLGNGLPFDGQQVGSTLEGGLEPGTIKRLPAGLDIKFTAPAQAQQTMDFAKSIVRQIAAGLGVPEYLLSGDLSGANYSSLRAGMVEFRRRIEQVQFGVLVPQFFAPVYARWLQTALLRSDIDGAAYEAQPDAFRDVEFYPPAWPWVDPQKDATAEATAIAAGLKSRRQAVAERGYDIEELDAEIAADHARETELGLSFIDSANAAPPPAAQPEPRPADPEVTSKPGATDNE